MFSAWGPVVGLCVNRGLYLQYSRLVGENVCVLEFGVPGSPHLYGSFLHCKAIKEEVSPGKWDLPSLHNITGTRDLLKARKALPLALPKDAWPVPSWGDWWTLSSCIWWLSDVIVTWRSLYFIGFCVFVYLLCAYVYLCVFDCVSGTTVMYLINLEITGQPHVLFNTHLSPLWLFSHSGNSPQVSTKVAYESPDVLLAWTPISQSFVLHECPSDLCFVCWFKGDECRLCFHGKSLTKWAKFLSCTSSDCLKGKELWNI